MDVGFKYVIEMDSIKMFRGRRWEADSRFRRRHRLAWNDTKVTLSPAFLGFFGLAL
ncbi:MAG: hypothetical protein OEY24_07000 [Candidatus Bathyarchaeota archaeon]|nr:hypothetical protein [Candidatus Bathyarchaeota archaeon]MDH5495429.1 hypothetical protein [Candidatus Bathyarchaeota archaeon]